MKQLKYYILSLLIPVILTGMEGFIPSRSGGFISLGGSYQQWTATVNETDYSTEQIIAPVVCFYPITPDLYLNISNSPASSTMEDVTLSGLSDTWIRTTYVTRNERFMFNLGVGAPTGKAKLTSEEQSLVGVLSRNAFRFRLPVYGQGLNIKAGMGMAIPTQGGTMLGLGVNYVVKGAYQFSKDYDMEYDPGDEMNVVAGFSIPTGKTGKWSTDVIYSMYSVDQLEGTDIYDAGDKILINTALSYKLQNGFFYGALRFRQRGKNEIFVPGANPVSQKTIGDQMETDGLWQFKQWPQGGLSFIWDGRFFSDNEAGVGAATIYGGGLGLNHNLTPKTSINVQMKYLMGTMESGIDVDVSGLDLFAVIKFKL